MTQHSNEPGGHGEDQHVHLPDPSVWPLIVGLAALFLGFSLVWWVRDRSNDFSGPILGAAVISIFIAIAGWAYDDSKMRRKAERAAQGKGGDSRFTQVVTFAVAEGRLAAARASGGILAAIESADSTLRDLAGFLDLRIIAAPAETGPSQTLVETTWSDREGLATYEETRRTILDLVAQHPDDVVPGSVQVFDMEVVRDTKEMSVKFGLGPAFAIFGALIVGGFMVGAGLTAFQKESTAAPAATATPGGNGGGGGLTVVATDNKFDVASLTAPPNTSVTVTFKNDGKVKHNVHFYDKKDGNTLATGAEGAILDGGKTETLTFTTPAAGSYYFQCDLHPDQMNGKFEVKEGAAVPGGGGAAAGGGAASGATKVVATDNQFDKKTLDAAAGKEFVVDFQNNGKIKHNLHFYDKQNGNTLATGAEGAIIDGGKSETLKFTPPGPGTFWYQCDLHPDQMNGKLNVK